MRLVEPRIRDHKVLRLVRLFLRAGVIDEHGRLRSDPDRHAASRHHLTGWGPTSTCRPSTGTSPSVRRTDMSPAWRRQHRRRRGLPNYRLVRYADDFIVLVHGDRSDAEAIRAEIGDLLAHRLRMTLSADKTHITHIDDRCRLPGLPYTTQAPERRASCRAHLPVQGSLGGTENQDQGGHRRGTTSLRLEDVLRQVNPNRAGLGSLGPLRRLQENLLLPGLLVLVETHSLDTTQAPQPELQIRPGAATSGRTGSAKTVSHSYNPAKMRVRRYRYHRTQICTPYNLDDLHPAAARFRQTNHNDEAFVGKVSEHLNPT